MTSIWAVLAAIIACPSASPNEASRVISRYDCQNNDTERLVRKYFPEDRLCGLVVRAPGYGTEMYCASCEVLTKFIYVTSGTRPRVAVALSGD
jgi:uncharacterized protein CbrC (UPF0167 family)